MNIKKTETESTVIAPGITVFAISKTRLFAGHYGQQLFISASKMPAAVLITVNRTTHAFRATGEEISLEQLISEFPELKEKLESF